MLVIYLWTRGEPTLAQVVEEGAAPDQAARRGPDLTLVAIVFLLNLASVIWFWLGGLPATLMTRVYLAGRQAGWNQALANTIANAVESTLVTLLPALVIVAGLFRLRPAWISLVPRHLRLGLALVGLSIGLAGLVTLALGSSTRLFSGPQAAPLALAIFGAHLFVNGLPEEFLFRGVILSRLVRWLPTPHYALVLTSVLFVASHIPSRLAQAADTPWWTLIPFSPGLAPTGLVWGYLCYRTRSIWPGVLWHASSLTLGVLFLE